MTRLVLRLDFYGELYIGHGRIELLELIQKHGSISRAAKDMGMSYKRAWYLMDSFGACFPEPLVVRQHGGAGGGSASVTPLGEEVIRLYRAMEASAAKACARQISALEAMIVKPGRRKSA